MSIPPPVAPTPLQYATPPRDNSIRIIAMRQRTIMYCILAYIASIGVYIGVIAQRNGVLVVGIAALCLLAVLVTIIVCVFRLALVIYSTGIAILLGVLLIIPYIGMVILLIMNSRATKILRANGISVGLMGANMKQFSQG